MRYTVINLHLTIYGLISLRIHAKLILTAYVRYSNPLALHLANFYTSVRLAPACYNKLAEWSHVTEQDRADTNA